MAAKRRHDFGDFTKRTVNKPASMDEFLKNDTDAVDPSLEKAPASEKPKATKPKKPASPKSITEPESRRLTSVPLAAEPTTSSIKGQGVESDTIENDDTANLMDRLTFSTTVSFSPEIMDELEMLWFKLKRRVPAGKKKKFSKSLLINLMIFNSIKEIDASDALNHPVVTALMQTIEE